MRRAFLLTAVLLFAGGGRLAAQPAPAGALSPSSGGGRPSNGGGAVAPSTRPLTTWDVPEGIPLNNNWLGQSKGRRTPGSGVDRTRAGFGGIAPSGAGPATRPDAGLGNPSTSVARPDRGPAFPFASSTRPDVDFDTPIRPFPGAAKMRGEVNPGWARKNGNAAAPSTALPAMAKSTRFLPGYVPSVHPTTGGYTPEVLPPPGLTTPGRGSLPRPVPKTGIVTPGGPTTSPGTSPY